MKETVEKLAYLALSSYSNEELKPYKQLMESMDRDPEISEEQKREILILNLFAISRAVSVKYRGSSEAQEILDPLHELVAGALEQTGDQGKDFRTLLMKRYAQYHEVLALGGDLVMFDFGNTFAGNFFGRKLTGDDHGSVAFITTISAIFGLIVETAGEMI